MRAPNTPLRSGANKCVPRCVRRCPEVALYMILHTTIGGEAAIDREQSVGQDETIGGLAGY